MKHANTKFDKTTKSWIFDEEEARANWSRGRIDEEGVIRWRSNGRIPHDDMLYDFRTLGFIDLFTEMRSRDARVRESDAALERYRKQRAESGYSAEEMTEMRAAFGTGGVEMVDVLTGERFLI